LHGLALMQGRERSAHPGCTVCRMQAIHHLPRQLGHLNELLDSISAKSTARISVPLARLQATTTAWLARQSEGTSLLPVSHVPGDPAA
jgi:hypothetical protein